MSDAPPTVELTEALAAGLRVMEERLLRECDAISTTGPEHHDPRMLAIAVTNLQIGFSCLVRSVLQPQGSRIRGELPLDPVQAAQVMLAVKRSHPEVDWSVPVRLDGGGL